MVKIKQLYANQRFATMMMSREISAFDGDGYGLFIIYCFFYH